MVNICFKQGKNFYVHEFDSLFSDKHCIVEVLLDVNPGRGYYSWTDSPVMDQLNITVTNTEKQVQTGKWDKEKRDEFVGNIQFDKVDNLCDLENMSVDEITKEACGIMINSVQITFPKKNNKAEKNPDIL